MLPIGIREDFYSGWIDPNMMTFDELIAAANAEQ